MTWKIAVPLADFINEKYAGKKALFAEDFGLYRQNVNALIKKGVVVVGGELYRPLGKWKSKAE